MCQLRLHGKCKFSCDLLSWERDLSLPGPQTSCEILLRAAGCIFLCLYYYEPSHILCCGASQDLNDQISFRIFYITPGSVALVTAGALCRHAGPSGGVASPHLWCPQSSVGFSPAPGQSRDTHPAPLLGFGVSHNDKVRKGREERGKDRSPQPCLHLPGTTDIAWPRLMGLCCGLSSHPCPAEQLPCSWGQPPAFHGSNPAAVEGCGSCLATGMLR